jgi:hypothetical protein
MENRDGKVRGINERREFKRPVGLEEVMMEAAGRALEIETSLTVKQKKLLRAMYAAMNDPLNPLPTIP